MASDTIDVHSTGNGFLEVAQAGRELRNMPWYNNPVITRRVLNRIANRYPRATLQDLNSTLDYVTQLIWSKQERYFENALQIDKR